MSKKVKYTVRRDYANPQVVIGGKHIAECINVSVAIKIARALNAMEAKPKAKPSAFDWSRVPTRYKFAAMDCDYAWYAFDNKPQSGTYAWSPDAPSFYLPELETPYPGDWRDSLQQRP